MIDTTKEEPISLAEKRTMEMAIATLRRQLADLEARLRTPQDKALMLTGQIRRDPALILREAGMTPDAWQERILRQSWTRGLLLCSRQVGKSQTAATLALNVVLTQPRSLVLLLSPILRQSGELFRDKLARCLILTYDSRRMVGNVVNCAWQRFFAVVVILSSSRRLHHCT